jgi:hypothetical protein
MKLQFVFAPDAADIAAIDDGSLTKDIVMNGGSNNSSVVYAPKPTASSRADRISSGR